MMLRKYDRTSVMIMINISVLFIIKLYVISSSIEQFRYYSLSSWNGISSILAVFTLNIFSLYKYGPIGYLIELLSLILCYLTILMIIKLHHPRIGDNVEQNVIELHKYKVLNIFLLLSLFSILIVFILINYFWTGI